MNMSLKSVSAAPADASSRAHGPDPLATEPLAAAGMAEADASLSPSLDPIRPDAAVAAPAMSANRTAILGAILVALGPISMALYTPAMPTLVVAFGTSIATVKLTLTAYFAGFALAQLVCGPLSDAYGRRPVTLAFMLLYLVASALALWAPTVDILLVARLLQGIGAAAGVAIARAIVRDLFTGQDAARIMNTIGIMLAVGPALSPTIGGITLELFGWHAIFGLMVLYGAVVIGLVVFAMTETNRRPDPALVHPVRLVAAYGRLIVDPRFIVPSTVLGAGIGALYALGTMLPFVLIDRAGLTPTQFGFGMMAQSLSFAAGGLIMRKLLVRFDANRLVMPGILLGLAAALVLAVLMRTVPPTFFTVMLPIGVYAFSLALIMPGPSTGALAPFPHMAGAAAALLGFMQMGGGLLGSLAAALFGDPVTAIGTILPAMMAIALAAALLAPKARKA
ncbi:multidrug effflux MFS transporter [Prosthecomicrobium hirschii]|uniref:multidrug effflux MFS transporter n=1 Tax=Prosthecodimorpha hirschii TaxID=665126 RepID=UPI001FCD217A|nr:multidrug effflux MFS transporter [Prosthecomicrobium hirschii]